jgi:hypothetical protein
LHSTRGCPLSRKPSQEPHPDFPLFLHQTSQWAKKVRGKMHFFGKDPEAALKLWNDEKGRILAGDAPRLHPGRCSVRDVVNRFLEAKRRLETGELSARSWRDYHQTAARLVAVLTREKAVESPTGLDFVKLRVAIAKKRGPVGLANEITRVRSIFAFALKEKMITRPVDNGASFDKPRQTTIRRARQDAGERMIEADLQWLEHLVNKGWG